MTKKWIAVMVIIAGYAPGYLQTSILTDGKSFDSKRIKSEKYKMDCYLVTGRKKKVKFY